jgi:hypothetical protein
MFVIGGALLAQARAFARYTWMVGGGIAALAIVVATRLAVGDAPLRLFVAGRLDWPVGYAPGMAGMSLFGMFVLLGTSCAAQQRWELRRRTSAVVASAAALAGAGACAATALLAQSRGTIPAVLVAIVVTLVALPNRSAWLLRFASIAGALLVVRERLAQPFRAQFDLRQAPFTDGANPDALLQAAVESARAAGQATVVAAIVAGLAGALLVPVSSWLREQIVALEDRAGFALAVPIAVLVAALGGTLLLVGGSQDSSPRGWIADQWEGCRNPPDVAGDAGSSSSYFANTGTGRCDYYSVALRSAKTRPVLGLGAGNFRGEYVRERSTREEPRVVHSLPLQLLAELGLVGFGLGVAVLGCVLVAATRFVRSGPARDATFAGAIGALAYWLTHASIDWLWQLPAVSLPAIALAGGLVACVSAPQGAVVRPVAWPLAAGVVIAAIALVLPVTMADSRLRTARDPALRDSDVGAAIQAALDAQSFDPTWAEPAIVEATLRATAGQRVEAADAARRAVRLEPDNWSVQLRASGLIGLDDSMEGLEAFKTARRLNPQLPATFDQDTADDRAATPPDSVQNPDS